jgi:gamma-tubulin complex component 2
LRNQLIPSILERDAKNILITGKYLNILKACNREIKCPFAKEIEVNIQHHINKLNFTEPIQRAYEWANQQLLQVIFEEHKLQDLIYSLKGYYFLSYGDLFLHFLDAAEDDLITQKKMKNDNKVKPFSIEKLQNLFDLNVRTSSAANDPYKEDISLRLDTGTIF